MYHFFISPILLLTSAVVKFPFNWGIPSGISYKIDCLWNFLYHECILSHFGSGSYFYSATCPADPKWSELVLIQEAILFVFNKVGSLCFTSDDWLCVSPSCNDYFYAFIISFTVSQCNMDIIVGFCRENKSILFTAIHSTEVIQEEVFIAGGRGILTYVVLNS